MSANLSDYVKSNKSQTEGVGSSSSLNSLISSTSSQFSQGLSTKWSNFMNTGKPDSKQTQTAEPPDTDVWFSKAKEDPCLPSLTKKQRILGFMFCLVMAIFCFFMCSLYIPVLVLKARKFALLYSMGSAFFLMSFAALWGPMNHIKHLLSGDRLPFTLIYFLTIGATLYFSMWRRSYLLTLLCAVVQLLVMTWYIISYIPGGQTGLSFFYKVFYAFSKKTASTVLPV